MRPSPRLLVCALLLACGDPQPTSGRAPIEPVEARCGPTRLPALSQPRRLLPLPGGRLAVLGTALRYDDTTGASPRLGGAWVTLDPTGQAPPIVERTDQPLYDGVVKGDAAYLLEWQPATSPYERAESLLIRRPIARFGEGEAVVDYGDNWTRLAFGFGSLVTTGGRTSTGGPRGIGWLHTREWPTRQGGRAWRTSWGNMGNPRVWRGMGGENHAVAWLPATERLIAVGRLHAPGDPDDPSDPGEHFGYSVTHGYTLDPRWTEPVIRPLSWKLHRQDEFEPLGAVVDTDGDPWLLAVEGHTGARYRHAQPFLVRLDPDTQQWTARIDPALPAPARQGAVLDAVSLADGGWIIGGAACDDDRAWCLAWVARLDRSGRTVWSREAVRDSAMVVRDLHIDGDRIYAAIAGGPYCCQFDDIGRSAWLWTLDLAGGCAEPPG